MNLQNNNGKIVLSQTADEIDQQTQAKIRSRYSEPEEYKHHRLALEALATGQPVPQEYLDYQNYIKACIEEGKIKKIL